MAIVTEDRAAGALEERLMPVIVPESINKLLRFPTRRVKGVRASGAVREREHGNLAIETPRCQPAVRPTLAACSARGDHRPNQFWFARGMVAKHRGICLVRALWLVFCCSTRLA